MEFHKNWRAYVISSIVWGKEKREKRKLGRQRQNFSGKTERRTKGALFKTKTKWFRRALRMSKRARVGKKKKREEKKNWCPRAWPYEYGRLSKMATSPAGLDASRIHVVRRIVESSRVGGGFTAAQSTGVCYPSPRGVPTPGWNTSLSPIRRFFSFLPLSLIPLSS